MKKFMKGVRFTPKNYSDEVEAKIQHYKKEGYKLPMRSALRTEEQLGRYPCKRQNQHGPAGLSLREHSRRHVHS